MIDARASGGSVSALINSLLRNNNARSTTLIVCSTRAQFLQRLISASRVSRSAEHNQHPAAEDAEREAAATDTGASFLLDTSIAVLAQAREIRLAFCPTVDHLRAYLLAYNSRHVSPVQEDEERPLLAVLDAIAVHQPTSEFTAQGLSRTIAMMVEVAARANSDFLLYESTDVAGSVNPGRSRLPWDMQVPLLNITARSGHRSTQQSNQEVPVRRIIQRWLHLVESEPEQAASADTGRVLRRRIHP
ncbi:hypothetical protein VTN31DRAFT_2065 [Thermomyces dupontii]|uniref:uncharacterized protein n=1 Tax=Talaromyces thermophilus TaxID=28565 RepID=UPI003742EEA1